MYVVGKLFLFTVFTSGFKTGFIEKSASFEHSVNDYEKLSGKGDNRFLGSFLLFDSPIPGG